MKLNCNGKILDLTRACVMGILNTTPDSFSDGGLFNVLDNARVQVQRMIAEGAAIIDVGGESTRPGAKAVPEQEELDRVIPVIEAITSDSNIIVSIDTSKAGVMREAVNAGAGMINDVCALTLGGSLEAAADLKVPVCLMHMQGSPRTMQTDPQYENVTQDVKTFLLDRVAACEKAGILQKDIILDPGFGFGKTLEHNMKLMRELDELVATGLPVLVGVSRKSMFDKLLGLPVDERLAATVAMQAIGVEKGAKIIRAHDVKEAVQAVRVAEAVDGII